MCERVEGTAERRRDPDRDDARARATWTCRGSRSRPRTCGTAARRRRGLEGRDAGRRAVPGQVRGTTAQADVRATGPNEAASRGLTPADSPTKNKGHTRTGMALLFS